MSAVFASRLAAEPVSKVEIFVSCNHLLDMDVLSKSDPICSLSMLINGNWVEIGRTERIMNTLNPQFSKTFIVDYLFEEVQKIKFMMYDIDNITPQLDDDDFLGQTECTVGELVSGSPLVRPLMLRGNQRAGKSTITLRAEEVMKQKDLLLVQFSAKGLDKKDFFGKSDPFMVFNRRMPDGSYQVMHRTEVIKNSLNPTWRPFEIKANRLCGGDYTAPIKVDVIDWNSDGSEDFIGSFETTIDELMQGVNKPLQWSCINPKLKAKKKSYQNSGVVFLLSCKVTKDFSFLDFIFGGLQLKFNVAIDFTASNGDPRAQTSLHYADPYHPNHYMRAIWSVGEVIKDYDVNQMFPTLGFGAKVPPTMEVSHCFAVNFNPGNPFCQGIQGILDAYFKCVTSVQLYGPTNFTPIINHVAQFAAAAQRERNVKMYHVLLILTDGVISDLVNTLHAIVCASNLPLSIIIVGVGNADFEAMDVLDSDDRLLRDNQGNIARRDIVQFVPFRQFERASQAALAKQVLAELPDQVVGYFKMNGIEPGKPQAGHNQLPAANNISAPPPQSMAGMYSAGVTPMSGQPAGSSPYYPPMNPTEPPPPYQDTSGRPLPSVAAQGHPTGSPYRSGNPPNVAPPYQAGSYPYPAAQMQPISGQTGYPQPGATAPYQSGATASYPSGTAAPYPSGTGAPYPSGTGAPYPSGTAAPYPSGTAAPYPSGTGAPYPSGTGAPYPPGASARFAQPVAPGRPYP